ncbi:MAG TPA: GNVR domain-containing protein [Gemmatimonadales bacterium]
MTSFDHKKNGDEPSVALVPAWREPLPPSPAPVGGAPSASGEQLDWRRVFGVWRRYRWPILAVTVLGTGAGVAASRWVRPTYVAQASIWIDERDRQNQPSAAPFQAARLLDPEAWVDLLQSYVVLDSVARDQRLYVQFGKPEDSTLAATFAVADRFRSGEYRLVADSDGKTLSLQTGDGVELDRVNVGDSVGVKYGLLWAPPPGALAPGRTAQFSLQAPRDAARALSDELQLHIDPEGNILRVELSGTSPRRIADVVNAIADRYVAVAAGLKRERLTEVTHIIGDQLQMSQRDLASAETDLEHFRAGTITLPSERVAPAPTPGAATPAADPAAPELERYFSLANDRDALKRDREALEAAVAAAGDSGIAADAVAVIPSAHESAPLAQALTELAAKEASLRTMRYRYAEAYPGVVQVEGEIAHLRRETIPALVRNLVIELAARETALDRQATGAAQELRGIPARTLEESRLRRRVALAENLYSTLQQRYDEAKLAEASTVPDVRVLDAAVVPRRPIKNTAPRLVLLALLGSAGVALVGAVLFDRFDPRLRYPAQVSREMGLTILGAVPHLRVGRGGASSLDPANTAVVVEALRGMRLSLEYAAGQPEPFVATVTSPGAGDGKSFLSANLALTFAAGGRRAVLIDGDTRRGLLHRRCGVDRRPGLSEYLRGGVPLEAVVRHTAYPLLDIIPCGTRVHDAPELLGGRHCVQLLEALRARYQVIICDSPPLSAGVDPYVLSTLTGNVVLVLRTGVSHREVAEAKLEMLRRMPVRILGAILNDVPAGAAYRYYSYYLPGYEAVDEGDSADVRGAAPRVL